PRNYAHRPMRTSSVTALLPISAAAALSLLLAACATPLDSSATDELRRAIIDSTRRELTDAQTRPESRLTERAPSEIEFPPDRLQELEDMSGAASYVEMRIEPGLDLLGYETDVIAISLRDAITRAVRNNLLVQSSSLNPAITEQQIIAAEAVFDWVLFANANYTSTDTPSRVPVVNGVPVGSSVNNSQSYGYEAGFRKPLISGGTFTVTQSLTIDNDESPFVQVFPDPARQSALEIGLDQPLLRNFGAEANLAEVRLAQNLERDAIQQYKAQLIDVVTQTESAYWNLYFAIQQLKIRLRLLDRGIETRDVLKGRLEFDVRPAEYSDAVATVESRRGDVIRARNAIRLQSDLLKSLINDPEITVGDELVLVPVDVPLDEPIEYSLLDAVTTGLQSRPEIQQAILQIDDASIRQSLADNQRLPLLDLSLRATWNGLSDEADDSFEQLADGDFIGYLAALAFEQPIGNRAAEAVSRQRRLERLQSVINYRSEVQRVILEIKASLRNLVTNYQLISQSRTARLAAAENLRTLLVEEESTRALTPSFLDLKLRRQEALAVAELQEVQAVIDYNIAIADLYDAIGAALERNQIEFIVPDVGDFETPTDIRPADDLD
ncbi:MAG: TolC family protein, partial [Planctomycetota bacterium]|nr:TolC family protein [Planctomycetota bacterium]